MSETRDETLMAVPIPNRQDNLRKIGRHLIEMAYAKVLWTQPDGSGRFRDAKRAVPGTEPDEATVEAIWDELTLNAIGKIEDILAEAEAVWREKIDGAAEESR